MPWGNHEGSERSRGVIMEIGPKAKARHVETLRGLACLLLVAYHVIGNDSGHGMHVPDGSPWRAFTEIFMHIRMPLFSFISGYVFSSMVADGAAFASAVARKLRRIGIPFVVVSTLFYVTFGSVTATPDQVPLWQIYVLPYEHYWYLQATLLIMIFLLAVALIAGAWRAWAFALLLPVAIAIFPMALSFSPNVFAIDSALYLLPYFLLGHVLRLWSLDRRLGDAPRIRLPLLLVTAGLALTLFVLDVLSVQKRIGLDFSRQSAAGLALGISACLALFFLRPKNRLLEWIGLYSYSIYLFHVFATAGLRRVLMANLPQTPRIVFFVLALAAGLGLPIVMHRLFVRYRLSALLLLGIDLKPQADGARPGSAEPKEAQSKLLAEMVRR